MQVKQRALSRVAQSFPSAKKWFPAENPLRRRVARALEAIIAQREAIGR